MATTGFWPVKGNLKAVIDYADNPDKTTERKYLDDDLAQALEYVANDDKTDHKMYISSVNCTKDRAYEEMMAVQRRFGLWGTNVAYHGFQSFKPGGVTPEKAHQIGIETARRIWGDKYQVVVTTHLNTNSVHNHMLVHAVSFRDGKKFQDHVRDHIRLREISDQICREHRLSVLEDAPFFGEGKGVYWAHKAGKLTHRDQLREAVEHSLYYAVTMDEFFDQLEGLGYEIDYDRLSVKAPAWERSIRLDRLGYPMEAIYRRLTQSFYRPGSVAEINENPPYRPKVLPLLRLEQQLAFTVEHSRNTGVVMVDLLFLILIQLLKLTDAEWSWEERCRLLSPVVRIELERLDQYTTMADLMAEHSIHTDIYLTNYIESAQANIAALEKERQGYRNQFRREKDPEKATTLKGQAKAVSKKLFPLHQRLKTARRIEDRLPVVRNALEAKKQAELDARERYPMDYAKSRGYLHPMYFVDDGISGTTFQRPAFQRMEAMIENGEIGTVIVKDLSRFGRNHIETGRYLEMVYPSLGVKFIAIQENIDTLEGTGTEMMPFHNIFNECYASQTSKKVRLISRIYEDNIIGRISDDRYERMSAGYEKKQHDLMVSVAENERRLHEMEKERVDLRMLLKGLREFTEIRELTPELVNALIQRIEIHNSDRSSGHVRVKVDIYSTAVGMIDLPTEEDLSSLIAEIQENGIGA